MTVERDLDAEFAEWEEKHRTDIEANSTTAEHLKATIIEDLSFKNHMSAEEYTLYGKWQELNTKYKTETISTLFGVDTVSEDSDKGRKVNIMSDKLWKPGADLTQSMLDMDIDMIFCDTPELTQEWNMLRDHISTMKNASNIGRGLRFIVKEMVTNTYLGVIEVSSDFMDLKGRDDYVGWKRDIKTEGRMINHTAIGSSIVPTQPLGFNYVGGKLLALLCLTDKVSDLWKEKYGDVLVGVTTTSLYGSFSQYQSLKYWNSRGHSKGSVSYRPDWETRKLAEEWYRKCETRKYWEYYVAVSDSNTGPLKRDHINRSLTHIYNLLGIDNDVHKTSHERGIYFATLYTNTVPFLCKEITEDELIPRFDRSVDDITTLWKTKYASKRIKNVLGSDRYKDESLFYKELPFLTWEEAKAKYLGEVGR